MLSHPFLPDGLLEVRKPLFRPKNAHPSTPKPRGVATNHHLQRFRFISYFACGSTGRPVTATRRTNRSSSDRRAQLRASLPPTRPSSSLFGEHAPAWQPPAARCASVSAATERVEPRHYSEAGILFLEGAFARISVSIFPPRATTHHRPRRARAQVRPGAPRPG